MSTRTSARTIEKLLAAHRFELAQGASAFDLHSGLVELASSILATESEGDEMDEVLYRELRSLAVALSEAMIITIARAGLATELEGHLERVAHERAAMDARFNTDREVPLDDAERRELADEEAKREADVINAANGSVAA